MTIPPQENSKKNDAKWKMGDDEDEGQVLPSPPDGGWGWMVVFASFMIHVLADGFTYSFGIFIVYLLDYYGVSKSAASWIASILVGVTLGSGPISGTLVNRFGCRSVTIAGAVLASAMIFVSIWAESIALLYVTIGVGTGFGFGLIYLPAIVCVTGYFEKRRSFATGIAVCGSGIGTMAFSPFVEYLIATYSWKGALIIMSAVMLNCAFFGALFRPLEIVYPKEYLEKRKLKYLRTSSVDESTANALHTDGIRLEDIPKIEVSVIASEILNSHAETALTTQIEPPVDFQRISSHSVINPRLKQIRAEETTRMSASQPLLVAGMEAPRQFGAPNIPKRRSLPSSRSGSGLLYRADIFYRGSLLNIPAYKDNPDSYRASVMRLPELEDLEPGGAEAVKLCGCIPTSKETRDTFYSLIDWNLMSDAVFLLFVLSNFCTSIGFNVPYIFIVDRAREFGIAPGEASYLLSVIGIANTVSRVVLGYISDQSWVNRLYLYNSALMICGIGTCLSIWFQDFTAQCFYAAIFGSMSGAYVGLTSVVLVDLLGMEKLTNAFGLLLLFQGIASLIGAPMCEFHTHRRSLPDMGFLEYHTVLSNSIYLKDYTGIPYFRRPEGE